MTDNIGVLVGAYYGLEGQNLPTPNVVVSLCRRNNIRRIILSEPNIDIFDAFSNMGVDISFGIPNTLLMDMANDSTVVKIWFNTYLKPYVNFINFNYIVVGQEADDYILPTMKAVQNILNANSIGSIKLTTQISYTSLAIKDPPSSGTFDSNVADNLKGILDFLISQGSPLMISVYPYRKYVYENRNDIISTSYATFGATKPVRDGPLSYYNLFDAMVDTFYAAIDKLNVGDVYIIVGETGWPTNGQGDKTTIALASAYNKRFKAHISSGKGTPRRPNVYIQGFIKNLFNEDERAEGDSRYYGVFNTDLSPIYPLF